jgi:hypothetical protein
MHRLIERPPLDDGDILSPLAAKPSAAKGDAAHFATPRKGLQAEVKRSVPKPTEWQIAQSRRKGENTGSTPTAWSRLKQGGREHGDREG